MSISVFFFSIDDIEDNSKLRRGIPVAHSIYGVAQTINSANYIYFLALERITAMGHPRGVAIFTSRLRERGREGEREREKRKREGGRESVEVCIVSSLPQSSCWSCIEARVRTSTGETATSVPLKRSTWKWSDKVGI